MVLELRIWGPAFGLPSIEPECIATVAYCHCVIPEGQWSLIAGHNPSVGASESLPILFDDGVATATGFEDIVAYLRNHPTITNDPDADLTSRQQTDRIAFITFLQSTATPLIDLLLYVSTENYNSTTASAYTAILPWYANYTVPPKRRNLARTRTAHMGLSSLDIDTSAEEAFAPGRGTASSEYEAAKRAAGIPTESQPAPLNMGRSKGIGGLFSGPMYAARFKLDAFSSELLDPLSDLIGKHDYILRGEKPSSLDCLAFGYLSLLFYAPVPQAWLKDAIQNKYPRVATYIHRLRQQLFRDEEINPASVWSLSTGAPQAGTGSLLPWRPQPHSLSFSAWAGAQEMVGNIPGLSSLLQRQAVVRADSMEVARRTRSELPSPWFINSLLGATAAAAIGLVSLAIQHRRSPRDGPLIFWALRPTLGFGEAGNILSVLAPPLSSYSEPCTQR